MQVCKLLTSCGSPGADAEVLPGQRFRGSVESGGNAVCRHSGGRSDRDDGIVEVRGICML
jgi:hypothetical protein